MSETQYGNSQDNFDDIIDLREIFNHLWQQKWIIASITSVITIVGLLYSLFLPNIYQSTAILSQVDPGNSMVRSLRNLPGLSLAGITSSSASDESNSVNAFKKLGTLSFFENNILPNIFLPDLMALDSWSSRTNTLNYDDSLYDTQTQKWVRKFSNPSQQIPTAQESFREFKNEHFAISEDKKTGIITLSIKHKSPYVAQKWTELMISEINAFYREKDKSESEKAVNYLNYQIALTNFSEVKEAISRLLQEETKKLALVEAKEFYVFEYIDPPAVMEKKSEPQRAIICMLSALLGGMLSIAYVLIRKFF